MTAATLFPLFFGLCTRAQAGRVAEAVRARLLARGGLAASTMASGQQWDAPNGWAPLQWIAVQGLRRYGQAGLAEAIARRWTTNVVAVYRRTGRLMEKYDVSDVSRVAGGGEYPNQDGFGWTNGVLCKLLAVYPLASPSPGAIVVTGATHAMCDDPAYNARSQGALYRHTTDPKQGLRAGKIFS